MLKLTFEPPKLEVADEVKNLLKKKPQRKDQLPRFWTHKERLVVVVILAITILGSMYFWYKGQGKLPEIKINGGGFQETIILEK